MADQAINALPTKTSPTTGDKMLMIGAAEEYQIDYDQLADAILNKLTSKTYTLDQGTKSFVAALNELNSKIDPEVTESYRTIIDYFKTNVWGGLTSGQTFFTTFTTNGPMHCALGYRLTSSNVDYGAVIIMTYSTVGTPHRPIFMRITSGTWYDPLYL